MKRTFCFVTFLLCFTILQAQTVINPTTKPYNAHKKLIRGVNDEENELPFDEELKPFYHGVASGDPLSDRVIIWTRVTPEQDGDIEVEYTVAKDLSFSKNSIVKKGTVTTNSNIDYTVKVDVDGLESATTYYYFFTANKINSIIGRTRTTPATDEADHLRFAVVSCSNYQAGYFNAYRTISKRQDLDAVIHLGDYIYELGGGEGTYGYSQDRPKRINIPNHEILTLADYRTRYSLYRLDPDLRAAHQQHPFIPIWDDHESANDAFKDGAENHNEGEGNWVDRKAISKKVYFEWMPIRNEVDNKIYRSIKYGNLAELIMIDTRLEGRDEQINDITDSRLYHPMRTLLGPEQKNWFLNQLRNSTAKWKVIGNQVIFSEFHVGWAANSKIGQTPTSLESQFLDIWDGYPAERNALISFLQENQINNVILLTGDFHSTFAFDVAKFPSALSLNDPLNIDKVIGYNPATGEGSVAVEFATPSITSANFDENLSAIYKSEKIGDSLANLFEYQINRPLPAPAPYNINPNPHMLYNDLDQHGYFLLDLKADKAQADWYFMETILKKKPKEDFAKGFYTTDEGNKLQEAPAPSEAKAEQPELAPEHPLPYAVTGVKKHQDLVVFTIFPNPPKPGDYLYINFGLKKQAKVSIRLTTINGQAVDQALKKELSGGNHTLAYKTATSLKSGVYLLQFDTPEGSFARRIVIH